MNHVTAEKPDLTILHQERGVGGPLATYREQRRLINAIIKGEIGETFEEKAQMRAHLVETANRWLSSDELRLQARGVRLALKLERQTLRTLEAVTSAVDADRRAMIEVAKVQEASKNANAAGETAKPIETVDDVVQTPNPPSEAKNGAA